MFSRLLFKSFRKTMIWVWCSMIGACTSGLILLLLVVYKAVLAMCPTSPVLCTYTASTPFMVFQSFWDKKRWVLPFENFDLFHCNLNCIGSIVLVHNNLDLRSLNICIFCFICVGWAERLLCIHTSTKFRYVHPVLTHISLSNMHAIYNVYNI